MRILLILIFVFSLNEIFPQAIADKYSRAMDAYNSAQYSTAVGLFDGFFSEYKLMDEQFAAAKYYG